MRVLFNGADDGIKSEPKPHGKNLQIIKDMLITVKSAEYKVLELKMKTINIA